MRVLSMEEFTKKLDSAIKKTDGTNYVPVVEILPNWQLKLSVPAEGQDLGRWLGPNPREMTDSNYTMFLHEVDTLAGSQLAKHYILDIAPLAGGQ